MGNFGLVSSTTDYSAILNAYGVPLRAEGHYWHVGPTDGVQGWILHLSVIESQVYDLLSLVVPELIRRRLAFKIALEFQVACKLLCGALGYDQLGKIICIYPEDDLSANTLAKFLISLTESFRGPAIPTDRRLGAIVYTRYASRTYSIPFVLPKGVEWPFGDITSSKNPPTPKLLNGTYFPLSVIKPDAKGHVIRCIYFKKLWQIRTCIVKQGRLNMIGDADGRDIRDRLKWQYDLCQDLSRDISLPRIFDYFFINDDAYLAMDFVKGITLSTWINMVNGDSCWLHLPSENRSLLIAMLFRIVDVVDRMHEKGYIHRDLTPDNFLIGDHGSIHPIDMELTWCAKKSYPDPPFVWGTPGHMSPEQMAVQTPTIKEDIYGLGGMMIMFVTNQRPLKFHYHSVEALRETLLTYTGNEGLAMLISSCWEVSPDDRPVLSNIRDFLKKTIESVRTPTAAKKFIGADITLIQDVVRQGLAGLALPGFMNHKGRWVSLAQKQEQHIGNEQAALTLSEGWHTGMTGPMWLVARAKKAGVSVEATLLPYEKSWDYLWNNYLPIAGKKPGLFAGATGVAYALIEGLDSELLSPIPKVLEQLLACFTQTSSSYTLGSGLAGQGIVLLHAGNWVPAKTKKDLLQSYVNTFIKAQQPDGSWTIVNSTGIKGDISLGMGEGIAGIIWFLLAYMQQNKDEIVALATESALDWLARQRQKKGTLYTWSISTKSRIIDKWSLEHGAPGIAGVFLKAYELLQKPQYAELVQNVLYHLPAYPSITEFTLGTGLAGLGEVYLEAKRVLGTPEWTRRSDWIASLLACSRTRADTSSCYWFPDMSVMSTADLFTGNSGIIHFLLRYCYPDRVRYPFS